MNPAKKAFQWLNHYIFSNTLHGTHSPFVYEFLEDVVYQSNIKPKNKNVPLIERIINSREKGKVIIFDEHLSYEELLEKYNHQKLTVDQETIFVFKKIRRSSIVHHTWKEICKDTTNKISIDLFEIGLLFFEQKKPKEHFKIYY